MSDLLVLRPGAVGDTLLAGPALLALGRRFPGRRIRLAGNAALAPLLLASRWVDQVEPFDSLRVAGLFRAGGDPPAETRAWLAGVASAILWLTNPSESVVASLRRLGIGVAVVAPSRPVRAGWHAADYLVASLGPLGVLPDDAPRFAPIEPPADASSWADGYLREQRLAAGPLLAIHPGSGGREKNWPLDRFAALAGLAEQRPGLRALVLAGPAEADFPLEQTFRGTRAVVERNLPLDRLAALLGRCAAYVGNDSGVSHLAAALGVPTLALFGPSDPAVWAPRGPRVAWLRREPLGALAPGSVMAALDRLLAGGGRIGPGR